VFNHLADILITAARDCPTRTALSCRAIAVSYGELLTRAQRVAEALRSAGVREGDRVAIVMRKSVDAVAAMIGSLISGAVYVPVDSSQPPGRIELIVADASCAAILGEAALADTLARLASGTTRGMIMADRLGEGRRMRTAAARSAEDLAFILYTSGSTGVPKGVCIRHHNLLPFVQWCLNEFDLNAADVFANHAAFAFDISTFDIYVGMAARGRIRLLTEDQMRNPMALVREITEHQISVWYSVPSALRLLLPMLRVGADRAPSLRYVLFAGEILPIKDLQDLMRAWPRATFYNLYGPTETNVCTYYRVQPADLRRQTPVPIGRPLPGVRARIMLEDGSDAPTGRVGELVVEGPCVTAGYWKGAESRNRHNHQRGVHATGDLVERDGEDLVYRGRIDHMVKIDGYRVEPEEIEAVLALHPAIEDVVVVALPHGDRLTLVACYSGDPGLSTTEMKRFCVSRLPAYMVPQRLRHMERLPRNTNGKVDRLQAAASETRAC
jgi:amino acid adenylation domain-containing protein